MWNGESHSCALRKTELKNLGTDFLKMTDLQKIQTYLLTNEHLSRIPPYPQANELTTWTQAGLPPLCTPCPWIQLSSVDSPVSCYSMHFPNCNSSAIFEQTQFPVIQACLGLPLHLGWHRQPFLVSLSNLPQADMKTLMTTMSRSLQNE